VNKKYIWAISIIIAAILWSLDWILIRPQFYNFSPISIVFLEHLLWAIVLSPFLILWFKKIKTMKKKDFISLFWVCLFGSLIWSLAITEAFFSAYRWSVTISTIIVLQKLQPMFALFLASFILKEKLSKRFYFWATISIISVYFIAFWDLWMDIFNVNLFKLPAFYAIIAAFGFGSSTVFWKSLVDDLWFQLTTSLRFALTSLLAFIVFLVFWNFIDYQNFTIIHWELMWIIVFTTWAWALFLYYFGLKKIPASAATIFELAWPLSAILFDYIFNGNMMNTVEILFSLILILSFFMIIWEKRLVNK
jgi:drug/metabolite transporter (DMT)-like permease